MRVLIVDDHTLVIVHVNAGKNPQAATTELLSKLA